MEGPSRLSCIWLFQGGRDSLTVSISIFMSNMLVMVRSRLPSICLEQCDDDSLVWKTRQTVAVGHFGGSWYLPPCVQNLAALHFPFLWAGCRATWWVLESFFSLVLWAEAFSTNPGSTLFNYLIDLKLINASSIPGFHGFSFHSINPWHGKATRVGPRVDPLMSGVHGMGIIFWVKHIALNVKGIISAGTEPHAINGCFWFP